MNKENQPLCRRFIRKQNNKKSCTNKRLNGHSKEMKGKNAPKKWPPHSAQTSHGDKICRKILEAYSFKGGSKSHQMISDVSHLDFLNTHFRGGFFYTFIS